MPLALPVVWSDDCLLHEPGGEVWIGLPDPGNEGPDRALTIRDALVGAGAHVVDAVPHDDSTLLAVHDPGFVSYLRDAWDLWQEAGYPDDPGQSRVVPYIFPHPGLLAGQEAVGACGDVRAGRAVRVRHDDRRSEPEPGRRRARRSTSR